MFSELFYDTYLIKGFLFYSLTCSLPQTLLHYCKLYGLHKITKLRIEQLPEKKILAVIDRNASHQIWMPTYFKKQKRNCRMVCHQKIIVT